MHPEMAASSPVTSTSIVSRRLSSCSGSLKILNPVGGPITAVSHQPSIHTLVEFITSQESPDLSVSSSTQLKPFQISGLSFDLFLKA